MNEADAIRQVRSTYPNSTLVRHDFPPGKRVTWCIMDVVGVAGPTSLGEGVGPARAWQDAAKKVAKSSPEEIDFRKTQIAFQLLHQAAALLDEAGQEWSDDHIHDAWDRAWAALTMKKGART